MKFKLEIELGNEAMQTPCQVCETLNDLSIHGTLRQLNEFGVDDSGIIRDENGNVVGKWEVVDEERERLRQGKESDGTQVTLAPIADIPLFRELSPEEEQDFRQMAREHNPSEYRNVELLHPVCRDEWRKLGKL